MQKFTYETLAVEHELRAEFFAFIDDQRRLAIKHGFLDAARIHAQNAKRIREELELFD